CRDSEMTGYRHNFLAGGSFFFTVDPADRQLQGDGFRKRSTHPTSYGRKAESVVKEVGLMEFWFQPDLFARDHVRAPDRYRSGFVAWRQRTARPVRNADGSISRRGFVRNVVIPGLAGKLAHARSWDAARPVNVAGVGHGARI